MADAFGVSGTLFYLQSIPPYYKKAQLLEMPVHEIYHWLRYLAWDGDTRKKYHEVMDRKVNKKRK